MVVCLYVCMFVCLFVCMFVCLQSVGWSVGRSECLSFNVTDCLSLYLCMYF